MSGFLGYQNSPFSLTPLPSEMPAGTVLAGICFVVAALLHYIGMREQTFVDRPREDTLAIIYSEAKEILRAISMFRAGVIPLEQLLADLREYSEFIRYGVDELKAPALRPADGAGDMLTWLFKRRVIHGALKQTIDAHGPINGTWIGSASKRIRGIILKRLLDYRKVAHPARKKSSRRIRPSHQPGELLGQ